MFSVIYKGFRPTKAAFGVTFVPAEIKPEGWDQHDHPNYLNLTIAEGIPRRYSEQVRITEVKPYQLTLSGAETLDVLVDFLNLSLADDQKEQILRFVGKYGSPIYAHKILNSAHPILEVDMDDIVSAVRNFGEFHSSIKNGLEKSTVAKMITNTLDHSSSTKIEMIVSDSGEIIPLIIVGNIFLFCIFSALSTFQENRLPVTCEYCGTFYQKGRRARKDAVYCKTSCRVLAHRRKKAAKVTTV